MNTLRARWLASVQAGAVLLALGACGGTSPATDGPSPMGEPPTVGEQAQTPVQATETNATGLAGEGVAPDGSLPPGGPATAPGGSGRVVCPACAPAGGETSDFGDERPPSACQISAEPTSIDLEAARALGFGEALSMLEASFDVAFEWSEAAEPEHAPSGYAESTRVSGSTSVASIVHQVPSLAGCDDWLDVSLAATLATADGALAIEGTLPAAVERDAIVTSASGRLDLRDARGSLVFEPPPAPGPVVGFVRAQLYVWPDAVRLTLAVGAELASEIGSDTPSYHYEPLFGMGPLDECAIEARPFSFDAVTPISGEQTFAERYAELQSFIVERQPLDARWDSGAETTASIELGEPLSVCDDGARVQASVPYRVRSADGRVDIDSDGSLSLSFASGAPGRGWVSASSSEAPLAAEDFADAGISGIDLGGYGGGIWHSQLRFDPSAALAGEISIEAHDIDGRVSGLPGSYGGVIDTLRW